MGKIEGSKNGDLKPSTSELGLAGQLARKGGHPLDVFFTPKTVAVIGASEAPGGVGRTILWNLLGSPFGGTVFPVNPGQSSVMGVKAYPKITDVPEQVELAIISTPARLTPVIIAGCADAGVRGVIIVSSGFRETGPEGERLENEIRAHALRGRMRVIGPNCLGVMSPPTGLNATFAGTMARPGNVSFISQSGALCAAVLDWSLKEMVGFSSFISIGSMVDVGWGDLIEYLGDDPRTRSIVLYMESVGDARAFLSAAREVALAKPIIVIKAGRTEAAAKAATSHTGALTGSDEVLDAAFRRSGVLRVDNIADLFYMAEVLAKQPRPRGPRLAIVTNAGGPGVLATDALIRNGGELAELSGESFESLNRILPPHWSRGNPVDILGDAGPDQYRKAVEIVAKDPANDGLLVILAPQAATDPTRTAEELKAFARLEGKPVLASWMGGADVAAGESILNRAGLPTFPYPDTAARAFNYMWRYSYNLRGLYETPIARVSPEAALDRSAAEDVIQSARGSTRTILTEVESKRLLACYGIPTVDARVAVSEAEAVRIADEVGYPVVLKLHSETITHKAEVGGVRLSLGDRQAVRRAYRGIKAAVREKAGAKHFLGVTVQRMIELDGFELILGSSLDPQFGPVLLFGSGGQFVEVYRDHALALPPLNSTLARRLIEQTRIYTALKGIQGRESVDLAGLESLLVRFSQLVAEQRWIREIDINPLLISGDRFIALDARVVVHGPEATEATLPGLAIRPYPVQYATPWKLKDGTPVTIRPIRPEDEPMMVRFHETLSERSVYFRYFHPIRLNARVAHERLTRMCFIDYSREMALVVLRTDREAQREEVLGVGRLIRVHGTRDAEFAILISDGWQRQGIGTELLARLVRIGKEEKLERIVADILPDNAEMQRVCEKIGFKLQYSGAEAVVKAAIEL
jgi:acetyltransferase